MRAGSNTTTDHITVLDQIPNPHRHSTPILIRSDSAGPSHGFLARIRSLRAHHIDIRFAVGVAITEPAPRRPTHSVRHHRGLAASDRRYRHPLGQGGIQYLEARHRAHARVEDRIRTGKSTGFGWFPSRLFAINQAWLQLALTGIDLIAWTQALLLDGDLAKAEPKKLRYWLLHVAARITTRRTRLAIAEHWPLEEAAGHRVHPTRRPAPTSRLTHTPTSRPTHLGGTRPERRAITLPETAPTRQPSTKSISGDESWTKRKGEANDFQRP